MKSHKGGICMGDFMKETACLFDLDGVVLNTEHQYSEFWGEICREYLGDWQICLKIKGNTLGFIMDNFFGGIKDKHDEILAKLKSFEEEMSLEYIPGAREFLEELKLKGIKTCIVTSSNAKKMEFVCKKHAEFNELFNFILTEEDFSKSKPDPEPYLLAAEKCGCKPENCLVFEDSFNGLKSGRSAGCKVIGLATTNSRQSIIELADLTADDFTELDFEILQEMVGIPPKIDGLEGFLPPAQDSNPC